ncbi:hypothetical protein HDU76_000096 [Blyttiomyces sp. JEL0837]|nr:hypothetical protein HDU76_000096 [Blyttiomyces sp. JEL0837]
MDFGAPVRKLLKDGKKSEKGELKAVMTSSTGAVVAVSNKPVISVEESIKKTSVVSRDGQVYKTETVKTTTKTTENSKDMKKVKAITSGFSATGLAMTLAKAVVPSSIQNAVSAATRLLKNAPESDEDDSTDSEKDSNPDRLALVPINQVQEQRGWGHFVVNSLATVALGAIGGGAGKITKAKETKEVDSAFVVSLLSKSKTPAEIDTSEKFTISILPPNILQKILKYTVNVNGNGSSLAKDRYNLWTLRRVCKPWIGAVSDVLRAIDVDPSFSQTRSHDGSRYNHYRSWNIARRPRRLEIRFLMANQQSTNSLVHNMEIHGGEGIVAMDLPRCLYDSGKSCEQDHEVTRYESGTQVLRASRLPSGVRTVACFTMNWKAPGYMWFTNGNSAIDAGFSVNLNLEGFTKDVLVTMTMTDTDAYGEFPFATASVNAGNGCEVEIRHRVRMSLDEVMSVNEGWDRRESDGFLSAAVGSFIGGGRRGVNVREEKLKKFETWLKKAPEVNFRATVFVTEVFIPTLVLFRGFPKN